MTIERGLAAAGVVCGNGLAWAQSITVGGAVTAVTAVGGAIVGLVVLGIREISRARLEARRQWEESNRSSLAAQNTELQASIAKLRSSLHEFRDESAARVALHSEEVDRLHAEIVLHHESNRQLRDEVARLNESNTQLRAEVGRLNDRIRELTTVASQIVREDSP